MNLNMVSNAGTHENRCSTQDQNDRRGPSNISDISESDEPKTVESVRQRNWSDGLFHRIVVVVVVVVHCSFRAVVLTKCRTACLYRIAIRRLSDEKMATSKNENNRTKKKLTEKRLRLGVCRASIRHNNNNSSSSIHNSAMTLPLPGE